MCFNNLIGRLAYGKAQLNFRKTGDFHKTNHPSFTASVRHPSPLVKTDGKPTKRIVRSLGLNVPELVSLRTKKSCSIPRQTTLFPKRIIPASIMVFPPVTQITTFFAYMPSMTLLSVSRSFGGVATFRAGCQLRCSLSLYSFMSSP